MQADYNQYILADPRDRRHVYLQLEEVFESTDGGTTWNTVGPYWNFDISCEEATGDPYDCPMTTHPDQHAGMLLNGQFWAGNDGGLWRRPASWHQRGRWTNLNPTLYTLQNYSVAVGKVGSGLAYWGGLQDNGESYTRTDMSRVEQAFTGDGGDTIVDPNDGNKAVEEYVYLDMYLTTDGAHSNPARDLPFLPHRHRPTRAVRPQPPVHRPDRTGRHQSRPLGRRRPLRVGRHQGLGHCLQQRGMRLEAGLRHRRRPFDHGAGHQRRRYLCRLVRAVQPGDTTPFARGLATNYGGSWHELSTPQLPTATSPRSPWTRTTPPTPTFVRLLQPALDSRRRCRTRLRDHRRRSVVDRRQRQPARRARLQDHPPRRRPIVGTEVGVFVRPPPSPASLRPLQQSARPHRGAAWDLACLRSPYGISPWPRTVASSPEPTAAEPGRSHRR